ncbi:transposase [Sporolactobacillus shoreae]|uniref:Transposase n=1 Tax=Sporolactobacillus shoreae TaxID=1465501 RepID=A0A4Z0GIX3_9BACL|nr:RNA-guided endonuclease TnpB family protein [Sporolactobacillus shoreae]TGA96220.1 transposase [Sporolactobacillus shoreae]
MQQGLTLKLKIKPTLPEARQLHTMQTAYAHACNHVSRYYFDHQFGRSRRQLHDALYRELRAVFNLKSQMAESVLITVLARYKTVQTLMKRKPYRFKDTYTNQWHQVMKDLAWLRQPIRFKRLQVDLVWGRDWRFLKNGQISINTLDQPIKVDGSLNYFDRYMHQGWKLGTAKLLQVGHKWFLHVGATKELPDFDPYQVQHVVGLDRGLRFLATCYDESGKTRFFSGQAILTKRRRFKRLRQHLQAKGTKSAKRRLKRIGQRENRWMDNVNHCLTKALVDTYGAGTVFVLEDLRNVRFATEQTVKTHRYEAASWSFFDFEHKLAYKAVLSGGTAIKVSAEYTSQRCPKCGSIAKGNRDHSRHHYHCGACGYQSNDDRIGAMNIQQLGALWVSGGTRPRFEKLTAVE